MLRAASVDVSRRRRSRARARWTARALALACALALGALGARVTTHGFDGARARRRTTTDGARPTPSDARARTRARVEPLSWYPRAFALRDALTEAQCEAVLRATRARVRRSTVVDSVTGESKVDPIRTSKQTFLNRDEEVVREIYDALSAVTMLPWTHNEDMQVLEYRVGEKYDAHEDVGAEDSPSGRELSKDGGKRVATVLLYLEEPEAGGETAFPDSEWIDPKMAEGTSWSKCAEHRVAMKPRRGDGLIFWSVDPNGKIDHRALHVGCPVVAGVKWTATVWVHAEPYRWQKPPEASATPGCEDAHDQCRGWANTGECDKNPGFMLEGCKWSCRVPGCEH
jgi:prolyl 4-hydroxylase